MVVNEAASELGQRVTIEVRNTRLGKMVVVVDKNAEPGIRPTTEAETIALSKVPDIVSKLDLSKHDTGDHIADVVIEECGGCTVDWQNSAQLMC